MLPHHNTRSNTTNLELVPVEKAVGDAGAAVADERLVGVAVLEQPRGRQRGQAVDGGHLGLQALLLSNLCAEVRVLFGVCVCMCVPAVGARPHAVAEGSDPHERGGHLPSSCLHGGTSSSPPALLLCRERRTT